MKLSYTPASGFELELKADQAPLPRDWPQVFVNLSQRRSGYHFSTLDLLKLNDRVNESVESIVKMSDEYVSLTSTPLTFPASYQA